MRPQLPHKRHRINKLEARVLHGAAREIDALDGLLLLRRGHDDVRHGQRREQVPRDPQRQAAQIVFATESDDV